MRSFLQKRRLYRQDAYRDALISSLFRKSKVKSLSVASFYYRFSVIVAPSISPVSKSLSTLAPRVSNVGLRISYRQKHVVRVFPRARDFKGASGEQKQVCFSVVSVQMTSDAKVRKTSLKRSGLHFSAEERKIVGESQLGTPSLGRSPIVPDNF